MLQYGTKVVAGVTPGKGGTSVSGVPVFDTVREAVRETGPNASIIFVPAPAAKDATLEAMEYGQDPVVVITENVPIRDTIEAVARARIKGTRIVGPNTPGVITPGECKLGIMPSHVFAKGPVGVVSRSGTLTYEIASALTSTGFGQSTCVGLGGDPVVGLSFIEVLDMFLEDPHTDGVVLIGEIGGNAEEVAAEYVKAVGYSKPIVGYVAGRTAPPGRRMGHAGAIVSGSTGSAEGKIMSLKSAGIEVAERPSEIPRLIARKLQKGKT
jgi:succinyl-CoA synthetase alpha subunit